MIVFRVVCRRSAARSQSLIATRRLRAGLTSSRRCTAYSHGILSPCQRIRNTSLVRQALWSNLENRAVTRARITSGNGGAIKISVSIHH